MSNKKKWSEISPARRWAMVAAGAVQLTLQAAALRDIAKRTPEQINGSKKLWVAASFLNFAGPIAYFMKGRRD